MIRREAKAETVGKSDSSFLSLSLYSPLFPSIFELIFLDSSKKKKETLKTSKKKGKFSFCMCQK